MMAIAKFYYPFFYVLHKVIPSLVPIRNFCLWKTCGKLKIFCG